MTERTDDRRGMENYFALFKLLNEGKYELPGEKEVPPFRMANSICYSLGVLAGLHEKGLLVKDEFSGRPPDYALTSEAHAQLRVGGFAHLARVASLLARDAVGEEDVAARQLTYVVKPFIRWTQRTIRTIPCLKDVHLVSPAEVLLFDGGRLARDRIVAEDMCQRIIRQTLNSPDGN